LKGAVFNCCLSIKLKSWNLLKNYKKKDVGIVRSGRVPRRKE
jgi:hypothetical protein